MAPPPAASVASLMTPGTEAEDSSINRDLLAVMDRPTLRYWALLGLAIWGGDLLQNADGTPFTFWFFV